MSTTPRCRKCGCYDYVHDSAYNPWKPGSVAHAEFRPPTHRFSRATSVELWFMDHDTIWAHVKAWAWLNLRTGKGRMAYIDRLYKRRPDLCWCNLVDSWWHAEPLMRDDYRKPSGCVCHFPMPRSAIVRPADASCYCSPIWDEAKHEESSGV